MKGSPPEETQGHLPLQELTLPQFLCDFLSLICIQWEEAEEKDFCLKSEKKASALSDASRKWFLEKELDDALEHAPHLYDKGEYP